MSRVVRRTVLTVASVLVATAPVVAHENHASHDSSGLAGVFPPVVFLVSVLIVSTAVYLDHQKELDNRWADVGVVVGVLGVVASLALLI